MNSSFWILNGQISFWANVFLVSTLILTPGENRTYVDLKFHVHQSPIFTTQN